MIVDGYIRVSQVNDRAGERFISPAVQRDAIEGWARLHGAVVGEAFEELDESGARTDCGANTKRGATCNKDDWSTRPS